MRDRESSIYRNVLENQSDGVIVIDRGGETLVFNAAAGRILGMDAEAVVGRSFGEIFVAVDGFDELSEAIIAAISRRTVGDRRVITVHGGEEVRSLTVTSSYLRSPGSDESRDLAIIVVFSDITEVRELREAEVRMGEEIRAKHAELRDAYRRIEESNAALATTMRKVHAARIAATVLVIGLFVAAGAYSWSLQSSDARASPGPAEPTSATAAGENLRTAIVAPKPVTSTISLTGRLAPWRKVNLTSPIAAKVAATHFQYGQRVARGDLLVDLDTAEVERRHRAAQVAHIKALKRFNELEDWENNAEVSRARRVLSKAGMALRDRKILLERTALLLEKGVIPASEHEAAQRSYRNQQLDFESAEQNLEIALAKNSADARRMARLELDNARAAMEVLADTLKKKTVRSPIAGVILDPGNNAAKGPESGGHALTGGKSVQEGDLLLTIGDFERMSVVSAVDEVDISKIRIGQQVRVSGDAFPGVQLTGTVDYVSSEARTATTRRNALSSFEVVVLLAELDAATRNRLRLGMTADLEVVSYHNPAALLVPIHAVAARGGKFWLKIRDGDTREVREIEVETGVTTVNMVEIVRGLEPRAEIVLRAM